MNFFEEHYKQELMELREQMSGIPAAFMHNLNRFFGISTTRDRVKDTMELPHSDPVRESDMFSVRSHSRP